MRSIIPATLAAAFFLAPSLACAGNDDTPDLDDIPHITIIGTAQAQVRPDLATIILGVTNERPTAKAAADENARKAQAVIDAAKAAGVPAIDIATQTVTLMQTFDPVVDANGHNTGRKPRGFAAANIISIKLRDLDKAGSLAESLIGKGANRFDGVQFSVEHPEAVLRNLIGVAVRNARGDAQAATDAADVRLGRVLLIGKPDDSAEPPSLPVRRVMAAASPSMPLEAGTSSFSASVSVTWAIEPK